MARLGVAHSKRIVVLSDDIHWVRAEQQQLVDSSCELYMGAVKDRELRDYSRADMIVAVTEEDAQYMRPYLKNKAHEYECVRHIPIIAKPVPALKGLEDSYRRRTTFLYVGSHHFGNRKAVRWLVNEVFPIVRRSIPEAQLHLVGADIWKEYAEGHEGVVPHGVIPELQPHMQAAKVMLVPNLVGGSVLVEHLYQDAPSPRKWPPLRHNTNRRHWGQCRSHSRGLSHCQRRSRVRSHRDCPLH